MTYISCPRHRLLVLVVAVFALFPDLLLASSRRDLSISEALMRPVKAQADVADEKLAREILEKTTLNWLRVGQSHLITHHPPFSAGKVRRRGANNSTMNKRRVLISNLDDATCDCRFVTYNGGGCTIVKPAPSGLACRCDLKIDIDAQASCSGHVVPCPENNAYFTCAYPGTDYKSCVMGRGNCGGYTGICNCDYSKSGGCKISKPAPPGTACKCVFSCSEPCKGAWACWGEVTYCHTSIVAVCIGPNQSYDSCVNGGGDCGGY